MFKSKISLPGRQLDPFICQFADAFVSGTELEGGMTANAIAVLVKIIDRLLEKVLVDDPNCFLLGLSEAQLSALSNFKERIQAAHEIAAAQPQKSAELLPIVAKLVAKISSLQTADWMFVPGGWVGLTSAGYVMHAIYRESFDRFTFVTCNTGDGLQ
jgi:hypothetical protein